MGLFETKRTVARLAFAAKPISGPYGGCNQWQLQVTNYLRTCGYECRYDLKGEIDAIVVTHIGLSGKLAFDLEQIREYKKRHPRTLVIHRINDNDQRKGTREMNPRLAAYDAICDYRVFISDWLRDHHAADWFDVSKPHSCILNGAEPAVFHPVGSHTWQPGEKFRFVTHHWSDNWAKGFDVYQQFDELLASGKYPDLEFWVIGRWPKEIQWKAAKTFGACSGHELADLLRQCHGYLTASRFEPGGMHFIEGMQCGQPVLFHEDGGGIVELAATQGVGFDSKNFESQLPVFLENYAHLRQGVLTTPPSGDWMCLQYRRVIQQLLAERSF